MTERPTSRAGDALGVGARLASQPSEGLATTAFSHELAAAPYLLPGLSYADLAHVSELLDAGVLGPPTARRVLAGLLAVHPVPADMALDPASGDLYNNRDTYLSARLGDLAGWIHLGRARREATTIAWQLAVRTRLLELADGLVSLGSTLLNLVEEHSTTVMPDYTYWQHAHPTTLGHYLAGFAYPVERHISAVRRAVALVNRSPAGSGSVNGSRFPLDRERLGSLLGFEGLIEHTRDAMWAPDLATEVLTVTQLALTTVGRLAEELQVWCTAEFGMVELDDAHSRISVVMPQKKNPYALAFLRGEARHALGRWTGVAATALTATGQPDNRFYAYLDVPEGLDRATGAVSLLDEVLGAARFDTLRMRALSEMGHLYATDMCDFLAIETGVDNRTLHRVVGHAVRRCVEEGDRDLTAADVMAAARELGISLPMFDADAFARNLDPEHLIAVRTGIGAAADAPMATMIADLRHRLRQHRAWTACHPLRTFPDDFVSAIRSRAGEDS